MAAPRKWKKKRTSKQLWKLEAQRQNSSGREFWEQGSLRQQVVHQLTGKFIDKFMLHFIDDGGSMGDPKQGPELC